MAIAFLALALAASIGAAPDASVEMVLHGDAIHLGDLVPNVRGSAAETEVARLPAGRSSITLSRRALQALVRRAVPAAAMSSDGPESITFRRVLPAAALAGCFVARDAIGAGEAIGAARVRSEPCSGSVAPVRYDIATGGLVATGRIAPGDFVGRALPKSAPDVSRGDSLTLVARSGAVVVERPVAALQPGRQGGRVFVRSSDGQVFAVPVAGGRQ